MGFIRFEEAEGVGIGEGRNTRVECQTTRSYGNRRRVQGICISRRGGILAAWIKKREEDRTNLNDEPTNPGTRRLDVNSLVMNTKERGLGEKRTKPETSQSIIKCRDSRTSCRRSNVGMESRKPTMFKFSS